MYWFMMPLTIAVWSAPFQFLFDIPGGHAVQIVVVDHAHHLGLFLVNGDLIVTAFPKSKHGGADTDLALGIGHCVAPDDVLPDGLGL